MTASTSQSCIDRMPLFTTELSRQLARAHDDLDGAARSRDTEAVWDARERLAELYEIAVEHGLDPRDLDAPRPAARLRLPEQR